MPDEKLPPLMQWAVDNLPEPPLCECEAQAQRHQRGHVIQYDWRHLGGCSAHRGVETMTIASGTDTSKLG
jgi:hypothetical protein